MRQMLLDLSLTTSVYNFLIVHYSDACFHSFCFDYFCKHVYIVHEVIVYDNDTMYMQNKAYSILFNVFHFFT
jgi:hypothetical protein